MSELGGPKGPFLSVLEFLIMLISGNLVGFWKRRAVGSLEEVCSSPGRALCPVVYPSIHPSM